MRSRSRLIAFSLSLLCGTLAAQDPADAGRPQERARQLAAENAALATLRTSPEGPAQRTKALEPQRLRLDELRKAIERELAQVREYEAFAGHDDTLGVVLAQRRGGLAMLVDPRLLQLDMHRRAQEAASVRARGLEYAQRGTERTSELREAAQAALPEQQALAEQVRLCDALVADYDALLKELLGLDKRTKEVVAAAARYRTWLEGQMLWTPSAGPLWRADWPVALRATGDLVAPAAVRQLLTGALADVVAAPWLYVLLGSLVLGAGLLRRNAKRRIREIGAVAERGSTVTFRPTLLALLWTLVLGTFYPLLLGSVALVARRAGVAAGQSSGIGLAAAMETGFASVALGWLAIGLFRHVCRGKGLGEAHFGWPLRATNLVRREFGWLLAAWLPLLGLVSGLSADLGDTRTEACERVLLLAMMIALACFGYRVLRPKGGVLEEYAQRNPDTWVTRSRRVLWLLAVMAPAALAVLTTIGWHHTALRLGSRLQVTVWTVLALVLCQALLLRWLTLARRRLAMEQLQHQLASERTRALEASAAEEPVPVHEPAADLATVDAQTRRLLRVSTMFVWVLLNWFVWVGVLPALRVLEDVSVWTVMKEVAASQPSERLVEVPITLASLLLAVLIFVLTGVAARNVPGLCEIVLTRRLGLQAGERYALATLLRYLIGITGCIVAFARLGIGWHHVQWLAAAATLGLGFGLQEIFANFVSGLILLFERPVRVGDFVAIGDVEGTVTRIRMRATTIVDADHRELIVPNRDLVTGRVFNWTLSDPIARITVSVGVAYGTDVRLVEKVLLRCAHDNPLVLKEPPPEVVFLAFGESNLDFRLRVFIDRREFRTKVLSQLNGAIERAFREAGVVVAFPTMDVNLKGEGAQAPVGVTARSGLPA